MDFAGYLRDLEQAAQVALWLVILARISKRRTLQSDLPSGAHICHVPVQDLKGKHVRAMQRVAKMRMSRDDVDEDGEVDVGGLIERMDLADMDEARHDALWALLIESWSFPFPVPQLDRASGIVTGGDVLDEIDADDYAAIDEILDPHSKKLRRRPNPGKATSSASSASSRAKVNGSRKG